MFNISMAESFLYASLALIIAGHWSFSSWLKSRIRPVDESLQELKKKIEENETALSELKTKMNAITLSLGFSR